MYLPVNPVIIFSKNNISYAPEARNPEEELDGI